MRRLLGMAGPLLAMVILAVMASEADASPPRIAPTDVVGVTAQRPVVDTILPPSSAKARIAAVTRTEQWVDDQGYTITISTDLPNVDLSPFAGILAGVIHGEEIEDLRVTAVTMAQIGGICGDSQAVACYAPDDPDASYAGQMWFAVDDPDIVHTVVHEYGHHIDNQLLNLADLGGACGYDNDGSRDWFFARDLEDDILGAGATCSPDGDWEHLLGELYAEDFVVLNGIMDWQLSTFRSPSQRQLDALDYDIRVPFETRSRTWRPRVRVGHEPYTTIRLRHWTFFTVTLRSPRRRDFDLYLYRAGKARPFAKSVRTGRNDRIERVLRPGRYYVGAYGYRGSGRARVRMLIE